MPVHSGKDKQGYFYQWGQTGKKYYYDPVSRQSATTAYNKAKKQQTAIYSSGWKGDGEMGMKLLKVVKKKNDAASDNPLFAGFRVKCQQAQQSDANASNGFVSYKFRASEFNEKNFVEINLSMPSATGDGSEEVDSLAKAIRITEARLKSLKEADKKLKKLQAEAKSLGFTL